MIHLHKFHEDCSIELKGLWSSIPWDNWVHSWCLPSNSHHPLQQLKMQNLEKFSHHIWSKYSKLNYFWPQETNWMLRSFTLTVLNEFSKWGSKFHKKSWKESLPPHKQKAVICGCFTACSKFFLAVEIECNYIILI